ncbi:MAG: hypothetical protein LBV75_04845 [Paludibacter sp.]|jgi:Trk-type K+ transport system membrane component|nr:hypothetical protein [Paludibacter sp.]
MHRHNEYQGGHYTFIEFIGLYIRFVFFAILGKKKNTQYLSGEMEFPNINTKQRIHCLIVGIISLLFIFLVIGFFLTLAN